LHKRGSVIIHSDQNVIIIMWIALCFC
jgi:hypothetical protein